MYLRTSFDMSEVFTRTLTEWVPFGPRSLSPKQERETEIVNDGVQPKRDSGSKRLAQLADVEALELQLAADQQRQAEKA